MTWSFDALGTLTVASVILWCGLLVRSRVFVLREFCIPAPLIGGVPFAVLRWIMAGHLDMTFDLSFRASLMTLFFTTVGLAAGRRLLRKALPGLFFFVILGCCLLLAQNTLALILARLLGVSPMLGLLAGSATLSGGQIEGLALAETLMKGYGLAEAAKQAMAAATFGSIMGSVIGGPVARFLIIRHRLRPGETDDTRGQNSSVTPLSETPPQTDVDKILAAILQILLAMFLGSLLCARLELQGLHIPHCITGLFVGALMRNLADLTGRLRIDPECVDFIGSVSLCLFLAMAIMSLDMSLLTALAGSLAIILMAETLLMILFSLGVTFRFMGKDFDAAIMAAGHCGMGLGTTSNAVANMGALCSRYGPAPRAFFIIPAAAALFMGTINILVIRGTLVVIN